MTDHQIAEKILTTLERRRFADWYGDGGRFDNYIRVEYPNGDPKHVDRDAILQDILNLFGLDGN